jgi:hypothetical protein
MSFISLNQKRIKTLIIRVVSISFVKWLYLLNLLFIEPSEFFKKLKNFIVQTRNPNSSNDILLDRLGKSLKEIESRFCYLYKDSKSPKNFSSSKISIILPVYKVELIYLEQAIKSVLWQSYKNWTRSSLFCSSC